MRARVEGKTKTDAKRIAGYSETSSPHQIEQRNKSNGSVKDALIKIGLTEDVIAQKINEGLNATKKNYFSLDGIVTDERENPDYDARHKYTKTALEVRGDLEISGVNLNLGLIAVGAEKNINDWNDQSPSEITENKPLPSRLDLT